MALSDTHHTHRWHSNELASDHTLLQHIAENHAMIIDGVIFCHYVVDFTFTSADTSATGLIGEPFGRIDGPHQLVIDCVYQGAAQFALHKGHSINQDLTSNDTRMGYFDGSQIQYTLTSGTHYRMLEFGFNTSPGKFGDYGIRNSESFRHAYYQLYCTQTATTSGEIAFEFFSG
jgi:hypothetical protein